MFALIRYASLLAYWTMVRIIAAAPLIQQQPSWFNQYTLADLASDTSYQQSKTTYFSHISVKKTGLKTSRLPKLDTMTKAIGHICVSFFSLSNAFRIEKYVSNERHSLSDYVWFILREVT